MFFNNGGMKFLRNANWELYIGRIEFSIHNQKTNEGYSSSQPEENLHVLNDFLDYYKKNLKNLGIEIKK